MRCYQYTNGTYSTQSECFSKSLDFRSSDDTDRFFFFFFFFPVAPVTQVSACPSAQRDQVVVCSDSALVYQPIYNYGGKCIDFGTGSSLNCAQAFLDQSNPTPASQSPLVPSSRSSRPHRRRPARRPLCRHHGRRGSNCDWPGSGLGSVALAPPLRRSRLGDESRARNAVAPQTQEPGALAVDHHLAGPDLRHAATQAAVGRPAADSRAGRSTISCN